VTPVNIQVSPALGGTHSPLEWLLRLLTAIAVLAVVGWADQATGYQLNLLVFYALPIAWLAWSVNFTSAVFVTLLSTVARVLMDASVHHYAHAWIPWERACMRLVLLNFFAFTFHQFRRDLDSRTRKVKQLEGILPVCIACNRISDSQGHWTDLDVYLRKHSEAQPEARLCPDCAGLRLR
jgi:hypothetical protein